MKKIGLKYQEVLGITSRLRKKEYYIYNSDRIFDFLWVSYFKNIGEIEKGNDRAATFENIFYMEYQDLNMPFPFKKPKP